MTAVELPVPEARWLAALRAEASRLARGNPDRLRRAGCERDDLVQAGALGYVQALQRAAGVTHRHAYAMKAARGAMRDALGERRGKGHDAGLALVVDSAAVARLADTTPAARAHGRHGRAGLAGLPRRIRRAVAQLPAAQQQTLRLLLQGRGPQEIAGIVGVSANTISLRRHHAVAALRRVG